MWKRPEVFKIWTKWIKKIIKANKQHDFIVVVAGSEGKESKKLCRGFRYVEVPNDPRWEKGNARTMKAKDWNPDYILALGSDDVPSTDFFTRIDKYLESGYDFIGITDYHFYDVPTGKAAYWEGYTNHRKGETLGPFRMLSSALLEKMDWKPWQEGKFMDGPMHKAIQETKPRQTTITAGKNTPLGMAIKSNQDIHPFTMKNKTPINPGKLLESFDGIF